MARVKYGSIITDIQGSIGGITYQKNGSGTIARLKPRRNQTNTQAQRDQQPRLKGLQREWNLLSLANKILWNDFAATNSKIGLDGSKKTLTGYQWFLTINQNRALFNDPILYVPPVYEIVNPVNNLTISFDQTELLLGVSPTENTNLYNWVTYSSFILKSASKVDLNLCRSIRFLQGSYFTVRTIANVNGTAPWNNYYSSNFPPELNNNGFYMMFYLRAISKLSGISSLAYSIIAHFIWDGTKYVIE